MKSALFAYIVAFKESDKGAVSVLFAVLIVAICAFVGTAVDYTRADRIKARLQTLADAAVLAAASQSDIATREAVAAVSLKANKDLSESGLSHAKTAITSDDSSVTVSVSFGVPTLLVGLLGIKELPVEVVATAAVGTPISGRACVLALNQNDDWGINAGSSSRLTTNCGVYVNNTGNRAIKLGSGGMVSRYTAVVGQWEERSDFTYSPIPVRVAKPLADPLAGLSPPSIGACNFSNKRVRDGDPLVLNPGVYCGGLEISTTDKVRFEPGTYVIRDGKFILGSSSSVEGDSVLLYFKGAEASIDWGSGAKIQFKAPSSGPHKGMLIWSEGQKDSPNVLGSSTDSILQGTVYSPLTKVIIGCHGTVGASADWTAWVVRSLEIGSDATLSIKSEFEASETPLPDLIASGMIPDTDTPRLVR